MTGQPISSNWFNIFQILGSAAEILTIEILEKNFKTFFIFWPCRPSSQKPPSVGNKKTPPFFAFRAHPRNSPFLGRLAIVSGVSTQDTLHSSGKTTYYGLFKQFLPSKSISSLKQIKISCFTILNCLNCLLNIISPTYYFYDIYFLEK